MRTNTNHEIKKYLGSVDSFAEDVIANFFIDKEVKLPIDINMIIEFLGIDCELQKLEDDLSGAIKIYSNNVAKMVINENHAAVRQNFTKAHEVGHLIAHYLTKTVDEDPFIDYGDLELNYANLISSFITNRKNCNRLPNANETNQEYVECNRDNNASTGVDPEEVFANRFAASLLMPASQLSRYLLAGITNIDNLASIFGVSKLAMEYRIKSLKLNFIEDEIDNAR